jgi:hypothetical protein
MLSQCQWTQTLGIIFYIGKYMWPQPPNGQMPDSDIQRYMGTYTIGGALKDGGSILTPAIFNTSNSNVNPRQDRESNELLHNS